MLTWEAIPLYSRKVMTFTDTNLIEPSPSNESAETLSISDIPSSRCLFRLRLSAHPTEETESSSLPLMLTPTSVQMTDEPEKMKERKEKNGYRNGTTYTSLETQVKFDPRFKGLLKTPSEFDGTAGNGKKNPVPGDSGSLAQEIMNGYVERRGLILPTPTAQDNPHPDAEIDETGRRVAKNGNTTHSQGLSDLAHQGLLPTPQVKCATGGAHRLDENGKRIKTTKNNPFSPQLSDLAVSGLLPTPNVFDYNTTWTEEAKQKCLERRAKEGKTAYPQKFNSLRQKAVEGLLPTPSAMEGTNYTNTYNPNSQMGSSLSALAGSGMLPTPRANKVDADLNNPAIAKRNKANLEEEVAKMVVGMLPTPMARDEKNPGSPTGKRMQRKIEQGRGIELNDLAVTGSLPTPDSSPKIVGPASRLSPLFTEEMMGFPFLWTTLPFLRPNGEPSPSKPTETQ